MSRFLTRLRMEVADDQDDGLWVLIAPLVYQSDAACQIITVPAGFHTDLASVPRVPLAYWLCGGTSNEAAVVHDYLYSAGIVSRALADSVLAEASKVTGVPAWRRWLMWSAVRLFGAARYSSGEPTPDPPASAP